MLWIQDCRLLLTMLTIPFRGITLRTVLNSLNELFHIPLTQYAIHDIEDGLEFYNSRVTNLGCRFADEIHAALQDIAAMPTAYSYRYKNVR